MAIKETYSDLDFKYKNPSLLSGLFSMENFDAYEKAAWMRENWQWSVYASIVYLIFIYGTQKIMENRRPFDLKVVLAFWNFTLAIFSIKGGYEVTKALAGTINTLGVHSSICGTIDIVSKKALYWGSLFVLSKLIELGDTAFIVLRKKKLIFLHWYHHVTVLICVWLSAKDLMATGGWFCAVNYSVHAVMYTYFGLTTLGVRAPKVMAMIITAAQFTQMVIGLAVNVYSLQAKMRGVECAVTNFHIGLVFAMYASYCVLFGHFFYKTYILEGLVSLGKTKTTTMTTTMTTTEGGSGKKMK